MSPRTNGLERDLNLVRRRAWLFIPFFILGLLVAIAFGSLAGDATAVATIRLEIDIQNLIEGGDRGLRIYDAESMTDDERFHELVRQEIGDAEFDMNRYDIQLAIISITEGTTRGQLTVKISDADRATADRYLQAWVEVFEREFKMPDGLLRLRYVETAQGMAEDAERRYAEAFSAMQAKYPDLPLDELVRSADQRGFSLVEELSRQEAEIQRQLAEVEGALNSGNVTGAVASAVLGTTVSDAQAEASLRGRLASLQAALESVRAQRANYSDGNLDPALRAELDNLRSLADLRHESATRWNNARIAGAVAQTNLDITLDVTGGLGGSLAGQVVVVLAVTVVFGLIAIYTVEWLSQVRSGVPERETA